MRSVISIGLALGLFALGCTGESSGASGGEGGGETVFPAAPLATVVTQGGDLVVEVRTAPKQPPTRGLIKVEYLVTDAAGKPVDGLDLGVQPWMPEMGHGTSTKPSIEAMGEGRYVLSNVAFFMPGRWELRTSIAGAMNDSATVGFQIE
jgi:hypothetical protein